MPPSDLAILIGAEPNTVSFFVLPPHKDVKKLTSRAQGTEITRIHSSASYGNLVIALLARRSESLDSVISKVRESNHDAALEAFPTDTSKASLEKVFRDIKTHQSFKGLKLDMAVYSIKHSSKKPFLEETREDFAGSLEGYVSGAFTFSQESLKRFLEDHGETASVDGGPKKGTLIFTSALSALRCSAQFAAYGAGRASVR